MLIKLLKRIMLSRILIFLLSCSVIFPSIFSAIIYSNHHYNGKVVSNGENTRKVHFSRDRASIIIFEDDVEPGGDAANGLWAITELVDEGTCEPWAISSSRSHSATHSWWIDDSDKRTAEVMDTPLINIPRQVTDPELRFWHYIDTESSYDGGWLQYRKDNGAWTDVPKGIISKNAYNDRIGFQGSGIPSQVEKQAWSGKPYAAFSEVVVDLTSLNLSGHMLNIRWRFESDGAVGGGGWWVDDVKITVEPKLVFDNGSISSSASSLYRYNGTTNITGFFSDLAGYEINDYELTLAIRDPEMNVTNILDNQTHGNHSLNVFKLSPGNFSFSLKLIPSLDLPFGPYDISVSISNVNGWNDSVSFDENDATFTLLSTPPFFRNETVYILGNTINVLDHRGIAIKIVFHDPDAQDPNDFSLDLYLSGFNVRITLFENSTNSSGLDISRGPDNVYNVSYIWHPEEPETMLEGRYEIELILREGDDYEIDLGMFDIARNVTIAKGYVPDIISLSCLPETLNVSGSASTVFFGSFIDPDTLDPGDFLVTINVRDRYGAVVEIVDNGSNGEKGITIVKEEAALWTVSCPYDPPDDVSLGYYDLAIGLLDGDFSYVSTGFHNNSDELQLYRNANPVIEEVECSALRVNVFGEDSCRFSAVFSDADAESIGNFSVYLNLLDPEGNVHGLVGGPGEDLNASAMYISPLDSTLFVFRYDIDPPSKFMEGEYLLSFGIRDGWQGLDSLSFGEILINLSFFYNSFPSPPMKIWPNSTTDTFPFISWWGALDKETPHDKLKYWIQIGTSPGDDNVLAWYNTNFSTSYQPFRELITGVYYIQVRCFDGEYYSDTAEIAMTITRTGNRPPEIPGPISPKNTVRQDPMITWGASTEYDVNDIIEYTITIGTDWHSSDIMKDIPTGVNTFYQLPFKLEYGTYYVQISANDGYEFSPVREQALVVFDPTDNLPPYPPSSLEPRETRNSLPFISWSGSMDLNGDTLFFWLQIGTSSGSGDVLPWWNTGKNSYFQLFEALPEGRYYFQLKCFDGFLFSQLYETTVDILTPRPLLSPTKLDPWFTTDPMPLLKWSGARYSDGNESDGNFSYLIRIGTNGTSGDIMPWTLVENRTYYQLEDELWLGKSVYVQIKTFDGSQYSNASVWTLVVTEFRLTVGFNVTNQLFNLEERENQILTAFIMNHGINDITVSLSVDGSLSSYVEIPESTVLIRRGELVSITLLVNIPSSLSLGENSKITLTAKASDGAVASSEPLSFERVVLKDEEWYSSLNENLYFIIGIIILSFTLILLLILIIKRYKRGRRERFGAVNAMVDITEEDMEEYISVDNYSKRRAALRRSHRQVDAAILETLRAHGLMSGKKRLKVTFQPRRVPLALRGGGGNTMGTQPRALPAPPPGDAHSSLILPDFEDTSLLMGDTPPLLEKGASEDIRERPPGPPDDTPALPESDIPDAGPLFQGPPPDDLEMDYLPPESFEITHDDPIPEGGVVEVEGVLADEKEDMKSGEGWGEFEVGVTNEIKNEFEVGGDIEKEAAYEVGGNVEKEAAYDVGGDIEKEAAYDVGGDIEKEAAYDVGGNIEEETAYDVGGDIEKEAAYDVGGDIEKEATYEVEEDVEKEAAYDVGGDIEKEAAYDVGGNVEKEAAYDVGGNVEIEDELDAGGNIEIDTELKAGMDYDMGDEKNAGTENNLDDRAGEIQDDPEAVEEDKSEGSKSALDDIIGILGIDDDEEF